MHETKLTSEISFPTDSLLAQLAECETDDLEVVGSIPSRATFYFALLHQCWQDPAMIWQEMTHYKKLENQRINQHDDCEASNNDCQASQPV